MEKWKIIEAVSDTFNCDFGSDEPVAYMDGIVESVEEECPEKWGCAWIAWVVIGLASSFLALTFCVVCVLLTIWEHVYMAASFQFLAVIFGRLIIVSYKKKSRIESESSSLRKPQ